MTKTQHDIDNHTRLLKLFDNKTDFKKEDYFGTMLMKYKKNNVYQLKLVYDYKKNAITSEAVTVKDFDQAINMLKLLEQFAIDGNQPTEADAFVFRAKPQAWYSAHGSRQYNRRIGRGGPDRAVPIGNCALPQQFSIEGVPCHDLPVGGQLDRTSRSLVDDGEHAPVGADNAADTAHVVVMAGPLRAAVPL